MEDIFSPQTIKAEMAEEVDPQPSSTSHCLNTECANKSQDDSRVIRDLKHLIGNKEEELLRRKHKIRELRSTNLNFEHQSRRIQHEASFNTAFTKELQTQIEIADTVSEGLRARLEAGTAEFQALQEQFANLQAEVSMTRGKTNRLKEKCDAERLRGDRYKESYQSTSAALEEVKRKLLQAEQHLHAAEAERDDYKKRAAHPRVTGALELQVKMTGKLAEVTRALEEEKLLSRRTLEAANQHKAAAENLLEAIEEPFTRFGTGAPLDIDAMLYMTKGMEGILQTLHDEYGRFARGIKQATEAYTETSPEGHQKSDGNSHDEGNQQVTVWIHPGHAADVSAPSAQLPELTLTAPPSAMKASAAPRASLRKSVTFADEVQDDSQHRALLSFRKRFVSPSDDGNVSGSSDEPLIKRVRRSKNV